MCSEADLREIVANNFVNAENLERAKAALAKALAIGLDFKVDERVVNYVDYDVLKGLLLEPIPDEGLSLDEVYCQFEERVLKFSTNFSSPQFLAFPDAGNAISGLAGSILLNLLNQNLINSKHCAPAATFVDIAVIRWMRELVGYPVIDDPQSVFDIGGVATTGGVLSNYTGLLLAREHVFPGTKDHGVRFDPSHVKVIVPDFINHYSIRASLGWMGLGEQAVHTVRSEDFRYHLPSLETAVKDLSNDNTIMAIVAYAGDSRSMTIDNFRGIHDITASRKIWFHIDACHGFQYLFSDKLRSKVDGIDLADSLTFDPHKVLFMPYALSISLAKRPQDFKAIAGTSDLIMKEDFAFGQITPILGSRNFSSLKLWFLLKTLGRQNIGRLIEARHELAIRFAEKLADDPNFVVLNREVNINSVVFMYVPNEWLTKIHGNKELIDLAGQLNKRIQDRLFREGQFYVHTFSIPDLGNVLGCPGTMLYPLRYMGGNPLTTQDHLEKLINRIKQIGEEESRAFV